MHIIHNLFWLIISPNCFRIVTETRASEVILSSRYYTPAWIWTIKVQFIELDKGEVPKMGTAIALMSCIINKIIFYSFLNEIKSAQTSSLILKALYFR